MNWFSAHLSKKAMVPVSRMSVKQMTGLIAVRLAQGSRPECFLPMHVELEIKDALKELIRRGQSNIGLAVMEKIAYMFDRNKDYRVGDDPAQRSATIWDKYSEEQLEGMKKTCQQKLSEIMHRYEQDLARARPMPASR